MNLLPRISILGDIEVESESGEVIAECQGNNGRAVGGAEIGKQTGHSVLVGQHRRGDVMHIACKSNGLLPFFLEVSDLILQGRRDQTLHVFFSQKDNNKVQYDLQT